MDLTTMDRRGFLKTMGAAGALTVAGAGLQLQAGEAFAADVAFPAPVKGQPVEAKVDVATGEVTVNEDVVVRYSTCLGCYCDCGNRVKIDRETGRVLGVGGNPYHPSCAYPTMKFEAPLMDAYRSMSFANGHGNATRGTMCARGQATWNAYSQPDRVSVPLKRAGKRGEGKWKPISWDDLIKEVTEGGKLFADLGENTDIEGFKALHDNTTPLNPDCPDLGPISNQIVLMGGRSDGRSGMGSRFTSTFGSINQFGHGSACGGAQWAKKMTELRDLPAISDVDYCEYLLWMGSFPGATGNSFQGTAKRAAKRLATGECTMDVLDPVLGNGNVTPTMPGINWVPIKTTTNAAFSCAAVQWMIKNDSYNKEFLAYPNFKAAWDGGYASFSNAAHLVIVDESSENFNKLLRADAAGLSTPGETGSDGKPLTYYAVIDKATGKPAVNTEVSQADIMFEGEVNGIKVRTAFKMMEESVNEHTIEEYAEICGVPASEIERIAKEFTSHGTKASARLMGGSACQTGIDTTFAYRILNAMVGSCEMLGGAGPCNMGAAATGKGARYDLGTLKGKPDMSKATLISRNGKMWEQTDEYKNRIAAGEKDPKPKLPWFAMGTGADNQALVSVVNQYPYQCKILLYWMKSALTSIPGAMRDEVIEKLKDPAVVPLVISCDVVVGEDTQYADYIVPDTNPYESFGVLDMEGWSGYGDAVRWPVTTPATLEISKDRYACWETFAVDVSERLGGLPGWGKNAMTDMDGVSYDFNDPSDYFVKAIANLAYDKTAVADIAEEEIRMQALDTLPEGWKASVKAEEWPKVLNVMSRGSRFEPIENSDDGTGRNAYAKKSFECYIWGEMRAASKNPYSSKWPSGTLHYSPQKLIDDRTLDEAFGEDKYPFVSTNYKPRFRSISMLANSPIMRDLCEHNYLEINDEDAANLGISDGDTVNVTNPSGDVMTGEAWVRGGVAKGTFAVAYGYGHRAYGAQDVEIDGVMTKGDPAIGAGVHLATMTDPSLGDGTVFLLADNEGSTPARSGGMYRIEKA